MEGIWENVMIKHMAICHEDIPILPQKVLDHRPEER